mmetsp:Transcript_6904/g.9669  ORF Transcript_6904/g.9669 Transcript_6904/m.9669 type:complete len:235 (-) Transcript_6904:85-789(-)
MGNKKGGRGRGGRRHFVTSAEDLEKRNENQAAIHKARAQRRQESDDENEDSEEIEENEESRSMQMEALRSEVVQIEKKVKSKGPTVFATANPNAEDRNKFKKAKDLHDSEAPELTRREKEELEKQRAADHYRKLHAEGKTDEYKADMERLAAARKRREELAAKQKSDTEQAEKIKHDAAQATQHSDDSDDEKLDSRTVKAMKPAQLKEALKKRGLSTQGQKKELTDRLLAAIKK